MPSDAAVLRPLLHSRKGLAVSQALNPAYSRIDTYPMSAVTIDEALRRVIAVGGDPEHLGGVDNFCWPSIEYDLQENPDGQYKAAQLVRANWALRDCCLAYGIPLLSGKDSMYIDGRLQGPYGIRKKVSGLPTLLFTASSVIQDVRTCVSMDAKFPEDGVYVLGLTRDELGGSEYYQMMGSTGLRVPQVNLEENRALYQALHRAILEGWVSSCHTVTRGGLGVHLALVGMPWELGMEIRLGEVPAAAGLSASRILYSESAGRFIVTVSPDNRESFEGLFSGMYAGCVGRVTQAPQLVIQDPQGERIIQEDIRTLKECWKRPFGDLI